MKKALSLILLIFALSCTRNTPEQGMLGTWIYTVEDAPFGFQTGRVIFYQENDSLKVKLKVYGISIACANLDINGGKVSFTTQIEHEQISIKLERRNDEMTGMVLASEGGMPISMVKKGWKSREREEMDPQSMKRKGSGYPTGRTLLTSEGDETGQSADVNDRVHTFYYGWYGNPETDGSYQAWNHQVIPHWIDSTWNQAGAYPGGSDIGANFYPRLGCYSSKDPEVIRTHMLQIREAGIGVVAASWWGEGHSTDQGIPALLEEAHAQGLKVVFHIEPIYETTGEFREHLAYLSTNYLQHPAIYRVAGKPLYYLYNSFQLNFEEWQSLLNPDSIHSLRATKLDGVFIGLWTTGFDGEFAVRSGFDGIYTYFASDGFAYGSTTTNWPSMAAFARDNNLIWIPSVGPGYADTRIRPWNEKTTRSRNQGRYYEDMFEKAVRTSPDFISVTSFNEWHEGTQIEPAVPGKTASFTYLDYGDNEDPMYYIRKTKSLIDSYFNLNQKQEL